MFCGKCELSSKLTAVRIIHLWAVGDSRWDVKDYVCNSTVRRLIDGLTESHLKIMIYIIVYIVICTAVYNIYLQV